MAKNIKSKKKYRYVFLDSLVQKYFSTFEIKALSF